MSTPLQWLVDRGQGVCIWCYGYETGCDRRTTYLSADEIRAKFPLHLTCEEAGRRSVCRCGARGRDGKVEIRPSILDWYDERHGKAPGTSERGRVRSMEEQTRSDVELHQRMGWPLPGRHR